MQRTHPVGDLKDAFWVQIRKEVRTGIEQRGAADARSSCSVALCKLRFDPGQEIYPEKQQNEKSKISFEL